MPSYSTQPPLSPEEWRPVPGHENWYEVSNLGRVRRAIGGPSTRVGRVLKPLLNPGPYFRVGLSRNNHVTWQSVHRLVGLAFIDNPTSLPEINHQNGIKTDNRACNLEWATRTSNAKHGADIGLSPTGERHRCAKLTAAAVTSIRDAWGRFSQRQLAEAFGVSVACIKDIHARRTWKQLPHHEDWKIRGHLPAGYPPTIKWAERKGGVT